MSTWLFSPLLLWLATAPEPLPADIVPGWKPSDVARTFARSELYGYIDGGAEIFLELGFEKLWVRRFEKGNDALRVEIFRMLDPVAALGIYLQKCGRERPDPRLLERHTIGRHQLMMWRDRCFVLINNLSGRPELAATMIRFAESIAARLPANPRLGLLDLLPEEGRREGSLRLIRGPFGLNGVYTLGAGDVLLLEGKRTAVAATYGKAGQDGYTRLIVVYPSADFARRAFANLVRNLDSYLEVKAQTDDRLVFVDFERKYGEVVLQGERLSIRVRLGENPLASGDR